MIWTPGAGMAVYVSQFTGECNRCGRCCEFDAPEGYRVRCAYLEVASHRALELVGIPGGTRCTVHDVRFDGMPIPMVRVRSGTFYGWRSCAKDSAQEDQVIARHVGRGCSLVARDG